MNTKTIKLISFVEIFGALTLFLNACAVGPSYQKPSTEKWNKLINTEEKVDSNWTAVNEKGNVAEQDWWILFSDSELNGFMQKIGENNQTLVAQEAQLRQARAQVEGTRANLFPNLDLTTTASQEKSAAITSSQIRRVSLDTNWELDLWGRVRKQTESAKAQLAATDADLKALKLSLQAELAVNYFELRITDAQYQLLQNTAQAYQQALTITQNQYAVGVVSRADVVQAQTQLLSTQANIIAVERQRKQLQDAIALLLGKSPTAITIKVIDTPALPGQIETKIPAILLESRPDVIAAERRVAASNAQIGVAKAAYFPTLELSASDAYQSNQWSQLFSAPNRFWSVGPSLAATLFDGGARKEVSDEAIAAYDATVANYRQTVLTSFREVEDNLIALDTLSRQSEVENQAVAAARESLALTLNQYKAGTVGYLNVVTAQTTAMNAQISSLQILNQQFDANIALIKALGGHYAIRKP